MAFITTGLTGGGVTTHFSFSYDESLRKTAANPGGLEPDRTNAVIAQVENDYTQMSTWFGGITSVTGIKVQVTTQSNGASWSGSTTNTTIQLKPGGASYTPTPEYLRYLLVSEVTEIFMMTQNTGWFQGSDEGSKGEGLSRFLGARLLDINGFADLQLRTDYGTARLWLNSIRADFVNNAPDDNGYDATNGCTTLFIWYLFTQLGFSEAEIVAAAASSLGGVYTNLTGDSSDPFPFFKSLLDGVYPSTTSSAIAGPNPDNPWPITRLSFWMDKNSFGKDEAHDLVTAPNTGVVPNAFFLILEGLNRRVLGATTPSVSGAATGLAGFSMTPNGSGPDYEQPADTAIPQRVRFPYDIRLTSAALADFPAPGQNPVTYELDGAITFAGHTSTAATILELTSGANPYFTNVNPSTDNVFWLSQDLRVFSTPAGGSPVPGGPGFTTDSYVGAYAYLQALLGHLNSTYHDPAGTDPFTGLLPGQAGALTADSSVTPFSWSLPFKANYNFAVARVRLRGSAGPTGAAQNAKVFFRMWSTQTADTDYQPGTSYLSHLGSSGLPNWPLAPSDSHTIPMFATGNQPNLADPGNPEYGANGVNNRTITIPSGDTTWAYFGCFLNVYDPTNLVNGHAVQSLLTGTHHCLVAQIAYDDAPIINANGVTESPATSDKLAQRNLQVTHSDNPGGPATHLIPQTFDLRPSPATPAGTAGVDQPDELMIDWGATPVGSIASIYWPQVDATAVLHLASSLYATHELTASDPHTLQATVGEGVTYLPIPRGSGQRFAGLLTIDLPSTVVKGQEFDVLIRRLSPRRVVVVERGEPKGPRTEGVGTRGGVASTRRSGPEQAAERRAGHVTSLEGGSDVQIAKGHDRQHPSEYRYVTGAFQVKIPVSTAREILPGELDTLAIMKWRLGQTSPTNRWHAVLTRYVELLTARVSGLGGYPDDVPPSPLGAPRPDGESTDHSGHAEPCTGRVVELVVGCAGEIEAFTIGGCCERRTFRVAEPRLADVLHRALRDRTRVRVHACEQDRHVVERLVLLPG